MNPYPRWSTFAFSLVCLACLSSVGTSQSLEVADPEALGMSSQRLARIDEAFSQYVEDGALPGAVALVARQGEIAHLGVYGMQDLESGTPMQEDTIFRIASQSKALVSVGIMILQEEGELLIGDTLDKYLPEFAQTSVAAPLPEGGYEVVKAERKITLRDLLTHTSGVGYGDGIAADPWEAAGIQGWYFADREEPIRETIRRMAELPFEAQPGERFVYGYSTDILGAVIEVASGQPLDVFLDERIFQPLGMVDTHFYLPTEKSDRLATVYSKEADAELARSPDVSSMSGQGAYVNGPRTSFSGGAGLLSTAHDYARFLQMMLNKGELDGQ